MTTTTTTGGRRPWGRVIVGLAVLGLLSTSVWQVSQDERGVVTRCGRFDRVVTPGFHFTLPWPIEWMTRVSTTEVRTTSVGEVAVEFARGRRSDDEAQWLTGDTNIFEMKVAVQYVVDDPRKYLFSIADFSDGRSRDQLIELATRAELTRLVARMHIDHALSTGKVDLQREARIGVQALLHELGMGTRLLAVNIAKASPPNTVIAAFNDVASAESDRETALSDADGYRRELLPTQRSRARQLVSRAEIYKNQVVTQAKGESAAFEAIAEKIKAHPDVSRRRLWLDMISRVLERGRTRVYSPTPGKDFVYRVIE